MKERSLNTSAEREAHNGSTRGTTKEATGTVPFFVSYCDNDLLLEVLL